MANKLYRNKDGEHFHRCEWCGQLEACNQECTQGGPWDPYGEDEIMEDGALPGGFCDTECYNHRRPFGACHAALEK